MRMDDTDKRILKGLRRNGRISHARLAEKIGISTQTLRRKVRAMESDRTISGYTVVLSGEAANKMEPAAVFLRYTIGYPSGAKMFNALSGDEETIEMWATTGEWDAVALAPHWDADMLSEFQERLLTHVCVKEFKIAFTTPGESFDAEGVAARNGCSLVPGSRISRKELGSA